MPPSFARPGANFSDKTDFRQHPTDPKGLGDNGPGASGQPGPGTTGPVGQFGKGVAGGAGGGLGAFAFGELGKALSGSGNGKVDYSAYFSQHPELYAAFKQQGGNINGDGSTGNGGQRLNFTDTINSNPYLQAAEATSNAANSNTDATTWNNRPNQNTPFGYQGWTRDANGNWSQHTGFNDALSGAADSLSGQAAATFGKPVDNGSDARNQAIQSAYGQSASRLDPQWAQRQNQEQSTLANQGLDSGSEAYKTEMGNFGRDRNDAYTSAMASAINNGNQAQALTFGQNMQAREAPLHEMGQMQGLLNMPGYNAAGAYQSPNYLGAYGMSQGYNLQQQQANNQNAADMWSGGSQAVNAGINGYNAYQNYQRNNPYSYGGDPAYATGETQSV